MRIYFLNPNRGVRTKMNERKIDFLKVEKEYVIGRYKVIKIYMVSDACNVCSSAVTHPMSLNSIPLIAACFFLCR